MIRDSILKLSEKGHDISLYFYGDPAPYVSLFDLPGVFRCYIAPEFADITKCRPDMEYVEISGYINKRPKSAVTEGFNGKTVTNIGELFEPSSGILCGDISLNIYNSHTLKSYSSLGKFSSLALSPELSLREQLEICKNSQGTGFARSEIIIYGRIPVMRCEHCFVSYEKADPKAPCEKCGNCRRQGRFYLEDEKKRSYPVIPLPETCQSVVLSSYEIDLTEEIGKIGDTLSPYRPVMRFNIFDESV